MATVYGTSFDGGCAYLSGDSLLNDAVITYENDHVIVTYKDGQVNSNSGDYYNLTLHLICDSDHVFGTYTIDESNLTAPIIYLNSSTGCATDAFWTWIINN